MVRSRRRRTKLAPAILLERILVAVGDGTITLTSRASLDFVALGYSRADMRAVLARLTPQDFRETVASDTIPGTTMDVYAVVDRRVPLYIKFQENPPGRILLVSFHKAKYPI